MTRIGFITRHPKRALSALGTVLAAAALVVGSGAYFTTSHSNPNNVFTAGTLQFDNSNDNGDVGGTILNVSHLRPGGPAEVTNATIENTGDVPADFRISSGSFTGDGNLLHALVLKITNLDTNAEVYNGDLAAMTNADAGHITDGDSTQYEFSVSLPETGADQSALMGATGGLSFDWQGVSTPNP